MIGGYTAKHWHDRAEEALAVANGMKNPEAKRTMENIAAGHQNLAERAECAAAGSVKTESE